MPVENPNIYSPARNGNSYDFVHEVKGYSQDIRAVSALNYIFTKVAEDFQAVARARNLEGLYLPTLPEIEIMHYQNDLFDRMPIRQRHPKHTTIVPERLEMATKNTLFFAPIGEYGEPLAIALLKAGVTTEKLFSETMKDTCDEYYKEHSDIITEETFTKHVFNASFEGIQTLVAVAAELTIEKLPFYRSDPIALLQKIYEKGIMNKQGLLAPIGLLVPMAVHGVVFCSPLLPTANSDDILLNPTVTEILKQEKRKTLKKGILGARGLGCPIARPAMERARGLEDKKTGIDQYLSVFLPYVAYFYEQEQLNAA